MLEIPQQTTSSLAPITILPVQRKLTNLTDVPSALSLPSEEQYSKCTYPLCFDFSKCPLTQPFHVFVYNHHFRDLFNLMYLAKVDNFVTQSSCTPDILTHVLTNPHTFTHISLILQTLPSPRQKTKMEGRGERLRMRPSTFIIHQGKGRAGEQGYTHIHIHTFTV